MTIYKKEGRRYIPVEECDPSLYGSFREGCHLVVAKPGSTLTVFNVDPNYAGVLAVIDSCNSKLCRVLLDASQPKSNRKLTDKQLKAWKMFAKSMGEDSPALSVPSAYEILAKFKDAIVAEIKAKNSGVVS